MELIADKMVLNAHTPRGFFKRLFFDKRAELIGAIDRYYSAIVRTPNGLVDQSIVGKFLNVGEELAMLQLSTYQLTSCRLIIKMVMVLLSMKSIVVQSQHGDIQNCAINKYEGRFETLLRLMKNNICRSFKIDFLYSSYK